MSKINYGIIGHNQFGEPYRLATDQKTVAERKWQAGLKPAKPQLPADHGLFSDDHLQLDLVEMLQEPTNE